MTTTIIMPTINPEQAAETARINEERAGTDLETLILVDEDREGYTKTVNRGLAEVDGPVCIVVDDAIMSEGWLLTFEREVEKRRALKIWFAGPSMRCRTHPQNTGRPGDKRRPRVVPHVCGVVLYATEEAVAMGPLDERMVHYACDVDWQRRATGRSLWIPSVWCEHELHDPAHMDWWRNDHRVLREKWSNRN